MKIRNLRLYFERYFNDKVTDSIGVSNDVIYKNIVNNKQLDSLVGDLVSFALNPAVQVFYELIQNGHDANADRVAFFIAEDYFIVINNGSSIRSDFPDQNNLLPKGQIISFLSKGLGEKYGDPDSIGKHGQGSKLLNFFLTPFSDGNGENIERNTDEKLKDEIINKLNGPIIFSWDILKQLEGLLSSDFTDLQCSEDFLPSDPLFFKVVLSYYPAFPGEVRSVKGKQGREIFTRAEFKAFKSAIDAIRIPFVKTSFNQGTLIFIPLGSGHFVHIIEHLKEHVIPGIRSSLPFLQRLRNVTINGTSVDSSDYVIKTIYTNDTKDKKYSFMLAYPRSEDNNKLKKPNFYQYFPISGSTYGLNFIINSEIYETDSSRQNLDLAKEGNKNNLKFISNKIISHFKESLKTELNEYIQFIHSVLWANQEQLKNHEFIKQYFFDNIVLFISEFIPTSKNRALPVKYVFGCDSRLEIPSEFIRLDGAEWLHNDFTKHMILCDEILGVEILNIVDIINNNSGNKNFYEWLLKLSNEEYHQLFTEISENTTSIDDVYKLPFLKFSDHSIRSMSEAAEDSNLILVSESFRFLENLIKKIGLSYNLEPAEIYPHFTKGKKTHLKLSIDHQLPKILPLVNELSLEIPEKWSIINAFSISDSLLKVAGSDLLIFNNLHGEKRPLDRLYYDAIQDAPSGILDQYELKGSENYFSELSVWLLNKTTIWPVILDEWDESVLPYLKPAEFESILADMNNLYDNSASDIHFPSEKKWIPSVKNTWVSTDELFYDPRLLNLFPDKQKYEKATSLINRLTTLEIVHFSTATILTSVDWADWNKIGYKLICEQFRDQDWIEIGPDDIRFLKQLGTSGDKFFIYFRIKKSDNQYFIGISDSHKQFITNDNDLISLLSSKQEYNLLPQEFTSYFGIEDGLRYDTEENFVKELMAVFGSASKLINIIERCSEPVKEEYLTGINVLDLYSDLTTTPRKYEGTYEGKLLKLISRSPRRETHQKKIKIDNLALSEYTYRDEIKIKLSNDGEREVKFLLSDLLPEHAVKAIAIENIRQKCKGLGVYQVFDLQEYDKIALFQKLKSTRINKPVQICFLVAYSECENSFSWRQLSISSDIDPEQTLELLFLNNLHFYEKLPDFPVSTLRFNRQIYTNEKDLLLPEENTPEWLDVWVSNVSNRVNKIKFLEKTKLTIESNQMLALRRDIETFNEANIVLINERWMLDNSLKWLFINRRKSVDSKSVYYKVVTKIITKMINDYDSVPEYLWSVRINDGKNYEYTLTSSRNIEKSGYLSELKSNEKALWHDALIKTGITLFYIHEFNGKPNLQSQLSSRNLFPCSINRSIDMNQTNPNSEWSDPVYKEWKTTEKNPFKIFIHNSKISLQVRLVHGKNNLQTDIGTSNEGLAERIVVDQNNKIHLYIYSETQERQSVINKLVEYENELFQKKDEKSLLIKLIGQTNGNIALPVNAEQASRIEKHADAVINFVNYFSDEDLMKVTKNPSTLGNIQKLFKELTGEQLDRLNNNIDNIDNILDYADTVKDMNQEQISRLKENINIVNALLEKADPELLKSILENLEYFREELEKEKKQPTPVALIGYIGERLIHIWLQKQNRGSRHVGDKVPQYDIEFEYRGRTIKIDVKTTISSLLNTQEAIPFFVKRSQYFYIKNNPDTDYYIIRLSLADLRLAYLYNIYKLKGADFMTIVEEHHADIDNALSQYLDSSINMQIFKANRSIFRMNMPFSDLEIFEEDNLMFE